MPHRHHHRHIYKELMKTTILSFHFNLENSRERNREGENCFMAVAATMSSSQEDHEHDNNNKDLHEHDTVMPGFRFHPTEEELVEFYLRRKVEGKRFNLELITFLDLYRYDPWELPALAAIGEKEWYFYVPRDRKYRNGDRPNRVTTSGYWKATGADRMIKSETFRPIGLKKTLVFYTGKAPKGIRTSWIMNEYRLPHHETERLQKAEISLCRVYKRAGVEDHPPLPRSIPTRASSSSSRNTNMEKKPIIQPVNLASSQLSTLSRPSYHDFGRSSSEKVIGHEISNENDPTPFVLNNNTSYVEIVPTLPQPIELAASFEIDLVHQLRNPPCPTMIQASTNNNNIFTNPNNNYQTNNSVDELHRLVSNQQASMNQIQLQYNQNHFSSLQPQSLADQNMLPSNSLLDTFPERQVWEWNSVAGDRTKGYDANLFK
ncbi:NAC domain-containing protein 35-like [Impatiens glandulifera]|uniref:NAC domain-containing protein 35-like n=1 Tax=Impatiens glandulifera TaxID=253017 RepID=UPI001FB0838E|nr:NAC domain-containing protein 35-like [Impatiens glandulifera]